MKLEFHFYLFFYFVLFFIAFTAIGTVLHELGHLYMAEWFGFDTTLHFSSVNWSGRKSSKIESFWITMGGPLQSMLSGTIGWWVVYWRKNKDKSRGLPLKDWFWFFLGLFWLRPIFNLFMGIIKKLTGQEESYFGGDEAQLSKLLGLPEGSFSLLFALIAFFFVTHLTFRILPIRMRFSFLLAAIFGSTYGLILWTKQVGPFLLP